MIRPWRLVLVLVAPLAVANCSQLPVPPIPPVRVSPTPGPAAAPQDPRFLELPPASPSVPPASPSPSGTPTPSVAPSPSTPDWLTGDLIAYEALPPGGAASRDLYVYNTRLNAVVPMTGANTDADESRPRLSGDRRWMVFQRTAANGGTATVLLDMAAQVGVPLGPPAANTRAPAISRSGRWVAYVQDETDRDVLVLYDLKTGTPYPVSTGASTFVAIDNPSFSDDARRVAFSGGARLQSGSADTRDLYFYEVSTAALWTLPFANSRANEDNPVLSRDGKRLLFDSDRNGTRDIFQANLTTGKLDAFSQLGLQRSDETHPAYQGANDGLIRFTLYPAPQTEPHRFMVQVYDPATTVTTTVPTVPAP